MKKLYFVFDQLPNKNDGGLISTYINLYYLLKDKYDINIISVFNYNENTTPFKNDKIRIINDYNIDNRFYKIFSYIKKFNFKKSFKCIKSFIIYFTTIKKNRKIIKSIINNEDLVLVSCPSAGIFMPKSIDFITEIHTSYKYFFGKNPLGLLQGKLMTKPKLTLFRTKTDAINAPKHLNPDYIYNFFDNSNIIPSNGLVKNKLCFVGRIEDVKDPIRLLTIAKKLSSINSTYHLDIYGDGSLFKKCKEKIEELNLNSFVTLKGFTSDKNIYSHYSILLLTSKYEGLPMSIIEAKANGIPTISTNWGDSIKEIINNGVDGFIIDNDDEYAQTINDILIDEKMQKELSKNALKSFDTFSKKNAYKRWIEILENYKK